MIEVNRLSWHAKVYLWWYYKKFPHRKDYPEKLSSNLCPYVRVVLIWAPLRWFFIDGRLRGITPYLIFGVPLLFGVAQVLGYISYDLKFCLRIISGIILVWMVAYALIALAVEARRRYILDNYDEFQEKNKQKRIKREIKELLKEKKKKKKEGPTFWELMKERALATHDRICPEITFKTYPLAKQLDPPNPPEETNHTEEYII